MKRILENALFKKITNIPIVWNMAQNIVGANQWKAELYPSVFEKKEGTLLDFGCSSGNETAAFLDFDYYGIDLDEQAIIAAQNKFKQYQNVQFMSFDIIKKGFKKDFFDHVLFAGTGHHLTDSELQKIFDILIENLKPGGQLHFFDIIRRPGKDKWRTRFIINSDQGKNVRTEETYKTFFDPQKYSIKDWKINMSPDRLVKLPDVLYVRVVK
jgi:SAM-dependent methyltransferase